MLRSLKGKGKIRCANTAGPCPPHPVPASKGSTRVLDREEDLGGCRGPHSLIKGAPGLHPGPSLPAPQLRAGYGQAV